MGKEIILQDGRITMGFRGGIAVTVDAIKTLQRIGIAYGLYSDYEESPDVRVELVKEPIRELVVMTRTSVNGASSWEKSHTLTRTPDITYVKKCILRSVELGIPTMAAASRWNWRG